MGMVYRLPPEYKKKHRLSFGDYVEANNTHAQLESKNVIHA
jgi:hypothetical protein